MLPGNSFTGLVDTNAYTPPSYKFKTALSNILQYGILTLDLSTPSFSTSIIKHLDTYFVFNLHSRDSAGMFCSEEYAHSLSASLGLVSAQFEITPFELRNLDPDNLHFTEREFEEAESSVSDDRTLATVYKYCEQRKPRIC